jgi:tRNA threonylcarbamoyl adenosine modification protein YeaZ
MKILALEFSTSQRSVAVVQPLRGEGLTFQSEVIEAGGRSTRAFSMIERVLAEAQVEREAIECIAVGLGPGSYTGVRAAIALAQGWQLAREINLLGLGSVEVLAARAQADGLRGAVRFVVDAQRGEFYCSGWEIGDAERVETEPLRIVTHQVVEALLSAEAAVLGPDLGRTLPGVKPMYPSARTLGRLALERTAFVEGTELKPVYLRETSFVKAPPPRAV